MEKKTGWWAGLKRSLRQLKEDLEKDSVANAGPSTSSCCHVEPEELERRREMYRQEIKKPS
jgi:hypothetical protein